MKPPLQILLKVVVGCVLLLLLPVPRTLLAHGGDEHADAPTAASAASGAPDEVILQKESQFLFDIQTNLVQTEKLLTRLTLLGQVASAPGGEGRIVAPQAGQLVRLLVQVGQQVKAGQVVAVIEQTLNAPDQVGLSTGRANAEAELRSAQQEYDRLKKIEDIAAKKDVQAAELRLRQARQNLEILQNQGSSRLMSLRSPITGSVDVFSLAPGQQLGQGDELFRVINPALLYIVAQVDAADLLVVQGATRFQVDGLQGTVSAEARLVSFSNVVNPANQARQLVLSITGSQQLRPGQSVNVRVQQAGGNAALAVPTSAVTDISGKPAVFVHTLPEVFKVRFVQVGSADDSTTVILNGLTENDRVVTRNTYQLKSVYLNQ